VPEILLINTTAEIPVRRGFQKKCKTTDIFFSDKISQLFVRVYNRMGRLVNYDSYDQ